MDGTLVADNSYDILVLLVDDQLIVGESIRRMLAKYEQIDFHFCASAVEAAEIARDLKPTVILQDLVMPGVDGMQLVQQYRSQAETSAIPVIVLSAMEDAETKREAFRNGANDYMVKLPDEIELVARIQYHSRAYLNQIQRDEAYRALRESQRQLLAINLELQRLTNLDGLTGLSNRRYFNSCIEAEWARAIEHHQSISLFMVDVDNFKLFNDTSGHLAGDAILKQVAEVIQKLCRPSIDCAARFGGDEFALILTSDFPTAFAEAAEQLRQEVQAFDIRLASDPSRLLTVSIGVATVVPSAGESLYLLIDTADQALYEAKTAGRNRVVMKERPVGVSA